MDADELTRQKCLKESDDPRLEKLKKLLEEDNLNEPVFRMLKLEPSDT
jgi:hypothetical protein